MTQHTAAYQYRIERRSAQIDQVMTEKAEQEAMKRLQEGERTPDLAANQKLDQGTPITDALKAALDKDEAAAPRAKPCCTICDRPLGAVHFVAADRRPAMCLRCGGRVEVLIEREIKHETRHITPIATTQSRLRARSAAAPCDQLLFLFSR